MVAQPITDIDGRRGSIARDNLVAFVKRMYPAYRAAEHHWRIAEALQAVERGDIRRLIITMPPRHGKSLIASEMFPAWFLGRNPEKRVIAASYAAFLAYRFSRRARNLLSDPRWPFAIEPASDAAQVQSWDIAGQRGGYVSAGVGGGIAGLGADALLIDDPVRNAADAESETVRESTWNWYIQDAYPRLEPGGAVVIIGTRWHEDDLIGRALAQTDEGWVHLDLSALAEDGDPLGRLPGDALWPERFDADRLATIRTTIGTRAFTALYQQRPSPAEGAILKREWWQHWREPLPAFDWVLQSWDTAFKTATQNDYSVCLTIGLAETGFYLLDLWRDRVEFPDLERMVRDQHTKWQPDEIVIEDAASGQSLIQQLRREATAFDPYPPRPLPIVAFRPDRDKVARVNAVSPYVEGGRVFVPADASWVDAFANECASFPTGAHDDQVDALSMGMSRLMARLQSLRPLDPREMGFEGLPAW